MNYYPFHIGDYAVHTRHLSLMEDLAYRRLIDLYYTHERRIPAETQSVARLIGMREHVAEVESVLREFFVQTGSGDWSHARCDTEIARAQAAAARARENGKGGGRKKNQAPAATGTPAETQPVPAGPPAESKSEAPNTQDQYPKEKKKRTSRATSFDAATVELPEWLDRELWTDWVADRKDRKKPITERAARQQMQTLDELRRQGHTPERTIRHAISSGNQGLYPPPVIKRNVQDMPERPVEVWKPPPPMTPEEHAASKKARDLAIGAIKIINKAAA